MTGCYKKQKGWRYYLYMQRILLFLSDAIIPLFIVVILMAGLLNRRNAYEDFVKGARDGLKTAVDILPTLAGLMVAVGILRASGLLDALAGVLGNRHSWFHWRWCGCFLPQPPPACCWMFMSSSEPIPDWGGSHRS